MVICKCRIDNKGRITLPKGFLKANGINAAEEWHVSIRNKYNSSEECIIKFERKEDEDE